MKELTRRDFFKASFGKAAAAFAGGGLARGLSSGKDYDLVIQGGMIADGTGKKLFRADVGVADGIIRAVGRVPASRARSVLPAAGCVVAPGFIDVHTHTGAELLVNPRAESTVRQGVTTIVGGNCGSSLFPFSGRNISAESESLRSEYGIEAEWEDLRGFLSRVERRGLALNYSTLVGQGSVRGAAMGFAGRKPTMDELKTMKSMVARSMEQGALGLSTGLEYTPGSFADDGEIIELCRSIAPYKGIYATHMRDEEDNVLEAIGEAVRISRRARVKLQISHLKIGRPRNWPKIGRALAKIEQARAEGLAVFCDRYPYIASATDLSVFFPLWSREGGTDAFISRLKDPAFDARLRADVAEQEKGLGSWEKVVISSVSSAANGWTQGKNIVEAARRAAKEPYEFMRDLLIEEKSRVGMISFYGNEDNLKRILAHPLVGVGSDGSAVAPYGTLNKGNPHPRLYGTFPRFLGKYVRDEKLLPLEEAVRKITSLPATHFGFSKRGVLATGCHADIVVFDPDKILDLAAWNEPARYPAGVRYVLVNGGVVVDGEEHTGKLPGKVLRKQRQGLAI